MSQERRTSGEICAVYLASQWKTTDRSRCSPQSALVDPAEEHKLSPSTSGIMEATEQKVTQPILPSCGLPFAF